MNTLSSSRPMVRYSTGAIVFHWLIALLIALNFAAAWVSEGMPKAERLQIMGNHKAIGITILILSVGRIVWRLTHRPPAFLTSLHPWESLLARVTHALFYILMIGIPLAGWIVHSKFSGGAPVSFFGLFNYPGLPMVKDAAAGETAAQIHGTLATVFLVLAGLHVLGALKHQLFDRDGSLWRMLPGGR